MGAFAPLKSRLLRTATNLRGWRTSRKLVVIESDDWGAIRMPGRRAFDNLVEAGLQPDRSRYDSLDCLETANDILALMDVIGSHRDATGRPATFTFNTVMGNPDFDAMESDGFAHFYHQHLFDSYRQYHGEDLEPVWRSAMSERLIRPQLHAREHLNTPLWLADLQAGHHEARLAFNHRFYGLKTQTSSSQQKNYLAACWPDSPEHMEQINAIVMEGLSKFQQTFGYASTTFIACNYVWPEALEAVLSDAGVQLLQTQRGQIQPDPAHAGATRIRRHYTGQRNRCGQHYSVRNVLFEPYLDQNSDWAEKALSEINQSFRLSRPAIVCSHRINYVSGMDLKHRDRSLHHLDRLLGQIRKRWPEVEFMTSDELSDLMRASE